MALLEILATIAFIGLVCVAAVFRFKHQSAQLHARGDMELPGHEAILARARARTAQRGALMIEPPRNLARKVYDNDRQAIGEALAERRLDDAIALYRDATKCTSMTANRVINRWMAQGRRVRVEPDPALGSVRRPSGQEPTMLPTVTDPVRDRRVGDGSAWPTLPERNQERFHSGE